MLYIQHTVISFSLTAKNNRNTKVQKESDHVTKGYLKLEGTHNWNAFSWTI